MFRQGALQGPRLAIARGLLTTFSGSTNILLEWHWILVLVQKGSNAKKESY